MASMIRRMAPSSWPAFSSSSSQVLASAFRDASNGPATSSSASGRQDPSFLYRLAPLSGRYLVLTRSGADTRREPMALDMLVMVLTCMDLATVRARRPSTHPLWDISNMSSRKYRKSLGLAA